jgi:glucose/arabinose dehydrogenase
MRPFVLLAVLVLAAGCGSGSGPAGRSQPVAQTATRAGTAPAGRAAQRRTAPRIQVLARGLEVPWDVTFLPDRRALVTERPGRVRLIDAQGRLQRRPVAEIPTQAQGEGGLMGIDLDPDFARGRPFAYVYVTTASGLQVQRWRVAGDGTMTRDGVVLGGIRAGSVHDSGRIRFGPDRDLYVLTGDSGTGRLAQERSSLNGKVLRLSPSQYRSQTTRPTIVSIGHRNPQGLDWQPGSNRLFTTEHGPSGFDGPSSDDEVNIIRRGRNYGWPLVHGRDGGRFTAPAFVWTRTIAPSGAAFVRAGAWRGDLLVAALRGEALHRLDVRGARIAGDHVLYRGRYGRLRAVVAAPDGSYWITTSNRDGRGSPSGDDDRVLRLTVPG